MEKVQTLGARKYAFFPFLQGLCIFNPYYFGGSSVDLSSYKTKTNSLTRFMMK